MKQSAWYSNISTWIVLAFFVFAGIKVFSENDISNDVKEQLLVQAGKGGEKLLWAGVFVKTLDHLTPSITVYKIPFSDKDIFLINKFPLIGWTHIIIIILLMSVLGLIIRMKHTQAWVILLTGFLIIIAAYFIGSIIDYTLYLESAQQLGITKLAAKQFMNDFTNTLDNVMLPIMMFAFISVFIIIKYLIKAFKHRRRA